MITRNALAAVVSVADRALAEVTKPEAGLFARSAKSKVVQIWRRQQLCVVPPRHCLLTTQAPGPKRIDPLLTPTQFGFAMTGRRMLVSEFQQ